MPEVKRLWRINGLVKPLAPYPLAEQAAQHDTPDDWHGKANGITLPRGRKWGVAHFLIAQDDLASIESGPNTIECYHENGTTTWKGWYVESFEAVTKQSNPAYWVRLVDPRWLLERSAAQGKRYNLRSSASEYIEDTKFSPSSPYTWSQVIADLWSKLPAQAGAVPALPFVPSTTPENLYFDGLGAWQAINQCLTAIGCCAVYDAFQGVFTFVALNSAQTINYPPRDRLLFDSRPGGGELALPQKAGVLYHHVPSDSNTYAPFKQKPHYAEGTVGGTQGTYELVDTFFYFSGRDLTARTTELATALRWLLDPTANPLERVYSGIFQQLPGSRLTAVQWISDGSRGMQTIVAYQPDTFEFPQLPLYEALSPGETRIVVFELVGTLASGIGQTATATVVVHNDPDLSIGATITVVNTGESKGYPTAKGVALKVKTLTDDYEWWVIEVDQHALFYVYSLTSDTHGYSAGGTPTPGSVADQVAFTGITAEVLTPYPFSMISDDEPIANPFNFHGKSGDKLLVAHVERGYTYAVGDDIITARNVIIAVYPQKAREFFIRLTSDVAHGSISPTLAAKGWGPIGNNSGQIPGVGETPIDRFYQAALGKINHTGIVSYDLFNEEYVVRQVEHWATRVKAKITTDFCDTPPQFNVTVIAGMNGQTPTTTGLVVKNRYGLRAGTADEPIDVLWDQIAGEWYPERTNKQAGTIEFTIDSITTATDGPYTGKIVATVTVQTAPCDQGCLVGTSVEVVDHSGCVFDLPEEDLVGVWGWATERIAISTEEGAAVDELTPCHWAADDRCCAASEGGSGG